ncbi:MAG: GTP pyrophosphokinase [Anaerolineae bacterium]|nr:GTP pyrophosphokinase [Anaerolineae bacterium]
MPSLEDAIQLALDAHRGQKDRAGQPYVLHPLRVMMRMDDEEARMAAILHDVVEDSTYTLSDLRHAGYPGRVLDAVDALSKHEGEPYEAYIERVMLNPLARRVKLADLEDNMDLRRISEMTANDLERYQRYRRAWARVTGEGAPL